MTWIFAVLAGILSLIALRWFNIYRQSRAFGNSITDADIYEWTKPR